MSKVIDYRQNNMNLAFYSRCYLLTKPAPSQRQRHTHTQLEDRDWYVAIEVPRERPVHGCTTKRMER